VKLLLLLIKAASQRRIAGLHNNEAEMVVKKKVDTVITRLYTFASNACSVHLNGNSSYS